MYFPEFNRPAEPAYNYRNMKRRNFIGSVSSAAAGLAQTPRRTPGLRLDLHTHFYTQGYFDNIRESGGDFSFDKDPTGRTIITHRGARFFGITPPMTNVDLRLEAMDRVGIDIQVVSLSTPNIFYTDGTRQPFAARMMNNAYADLVSKYPKRFKAFADRGPKARLDIGARGVDAPGKLAGEVLEANHRGGLGRAVGDGFQPGVQGAEGAFEVAQGLGHPRLDLVQTFGGGGA